MQDQLSPFQGQNEVVCHSLPPSSFSASCIYFPTPRTPLRTSGALSNALSTGEVSDLSIPGTASPNHPRLLGPTASSITELKLDQDPARPEAVAAAGAETASYRGPKSRSPRNWPQPKGPCSLLQGLDLPCLRRSQAVRPHLKPATQPLKRPTDPLTRRLTDVELP